MFFVMNAYLGVSVILSNAASIQGTRLLHALRERQARVLAVSAQVVETGWPEPLGCQLLQADIGTPQGRAEVVSVARQWARSPRFLFHAVDSTPGGYFEEAGELAWQAMMQRNLLSPLALTRALLPLLLSADAPRVVAFADGQARRGSHCAASFALRGAFDALGQAYRHSDLRFMHLDLDEPPPRSRSPLARFAGSTDGTGSSLARNLERIGRKPPRVSLAPFESLRRGFD